MNAIELLIADHNRVRGLFASFDDAHDRDDTEAMRQIESRIARELEVHTIIEEEIFYPKVVELSDEFRELVAEGTEEHHVAKTLVAELSAVRGGEDEVFVAKTKVLIEGVSHHAEEEETSMLPKVRSAMESASLDRLGDTIESRKKQLGAPTLADKIDLTKQELLSLAREQQIPGRSTMSREELAATVAPR